MGSAWDFATTNGAQGAAMSAGGSHYAWAVMDGDVNAVPIPDTVWLFGSGLIGLIGIARRKTLT